MTFTGLYLACLAARGRAPVTPRDPLNHALSEPLEFLRAREVETARRPDPSAYRICRRKSFAIMTSPRENSILGIFLFCRIKINIFVFHHPRNKYIYVENKNTLEMYFPAAS